MREAFLFGVYTSLCVCVCTQACVTVCLLANFHMSVSSLYAFEPERKKKKKLKGIHHSVTVSLRWVGPAKKRGEWCTLCLLKTTFMFQPKLWENATGHVRKTQISLGWSPCVDRSLTPPERKTHLRKKDMFDIKGKSDALLRLSLFLIHMSQSAPFGISLNLLLNKVSTVSRLQSPHLLLHGHNRLGQHCYDYTWANVWGDIKGPRH